MAEKKRSVFKPSGQKTHSWRIHPDAAGAATGGIRPGTGRILHVAAGCWKNGGGLSEAVAQVVLTQARAGYRVTLVFLGGEAEHPVLQSCRTAGAEIVICTPTGPRTLYFSSELYKKIPELVKNSDFVHIHGGWTFPLWRAAGCAKRAGVPYAVSLHGTLGPLSLAKSRLRKKFCWKLFDRNMLRAAAWLHAATETEAGWIRDRLGADAPKIRVIPWGVDGSALECSPQVRTQTLLFLGRRHPMKGLDLLADAWYSVPDELKFGWELIIAGPDEGARFPIYRGMKVIPPLYGKAKAEMLHRVHAVVLPSRSENFGLSVAEALYCGTPVLCTAGVPWELPEGFRVAGTAKALSEGLSRLLSTSDTELRKAFAPLYTEVRKRCTWDTVAHQLLPRR